MKPKIHHGIVTRVKVAVGPEQQGYRFIADLNPFPIDFRVVYGGPGTMTPRQFAETMGSRVSTEATLEEDGETDSGVITLRDRNNNPDGSAKCIGIYRHISRVPAAPPACGLLPITDDPFDLLSR